MSRVVLLACMLAWAAVAQPGGTRNAAISGVVKDSVNGRPLANYSVSTDINPTFSSEAVRMTAQTRQPSSVTDEEGRYKLDDLPPGSYRITARGPRGFSSTLTRNVILAGRDLEHIDFSVAVSGTITGRVLDENLEPVPGMGVRLVSREYFSGVLGYFFKNTANTDDRGVYTLPNVEAGHPYLVMAERSAFRLPAHSEAPLDPKLRRRVAMRTFYPNSPDREGGAVVTLRPGETRDGIDIEIRKTASYCVEGTTMSLGGPAPLAFNVEAAQPAYGASSSSGMYGPLPGATTGPDGKFRVCDLSPGSYRFTANDRAQANPNRALMPVEIVDRDIRNVNLTIGPGYPLIGEVLWDGAAPETPTTVKVNLSVEPLLRSPIANERGNARADLPGRFSIPGMIPSDYALRARIGGSGLYIKDVTYGGRSVLYDPLHFGSAMGNLGLRVLVARDGVTLTARVQDADGNPLPDLRVVVFPAAISSEAMLQAALVTGQTDQMGQFRSAALGPGKYVVLATQDRVDATPECIDNLWRSRSRFQEVELPAGGAAETRLTPVSLK